MHCSHTEQDANPEWGSHQIVKAALAAGLVSVVDSFTMQMPLTFLDQTIYVSIA